MRPKLNLLNVQYNGYTFLKKIGRGTFSYVWLASKNDIEYAIKIDKTDNEFYEEEVEVLSKFKNSPRIINMTDNFVMEVSDRKYYCIVLELMGPHLLWLIDNYARNKTNIPKNIILRILKQSAEGINEIHSHNYIHSDLKPDNILLTKKFDQKVFKYSKKKYASKLARMNPSELLYYDVMRELLLYMNCNVKISDLGNAFINEYKRHRNIVTRHYRPPEIILGDKYSLTLDVWSLGCIIYELITGTILFVPKKIDAINGIKMCHIALIIKIFGDFPENMIARAKFSSKYFDLKHPNYTYLCKYLLDSPYPLYKIFKYYNIKKKDANAYSMLLNPLFTIDPNERISIKNYLSYIDNFNIKS